MKTINFVSRRQKNLNKQQLIDVKYFYISAAVLAVVVTVTAITLGLQWYVFSQLRSVESESESLQAQILSGENKENTFIVLVHKLGAMSRVMDERQKRQAAVDYFSSIFGSSVLVEEMRYEEDQNKQLLVFKLVSKDVFILETVLEKLQSVELKKIYAQVKVGGLNRSERGSYSLDVVVPLSQG
ncbi:MAG: hypothetical protein ABFQ62_01810 [Patescibacteria group bacterium]